MMTTDETAIVNGMVHDFLDPFDPNDDPQEGGDDPADYDTDKDQDGRADPDEQPEPWPDAPCRNCGGAHHIQRSPEIADALPNPGRAIARHFHSRPQHFIATLKQFDREMWPILAIPFALYHRKTVRWALDTWTKAADGDVRLPANARA